MPGKVEALGILLVLLPGFACAYLVQMLAVRRKQSDFEKIIEALLFSLLLYLFTLPFFGYTFPLSWQPATQQNADPFQIKVHWVQLFVLTAASGVLGILYSANVNGDWLLTVLRWLHITDRTTRKTIWNDAFQEFGGMVQVGLSGERKVLGWLRYYSDEAEDSSLFLESASWVSEDENGEVIERPIFGPDILLTKDSGIEYVMFLNSARETAEAHHENQ